MSKKVEVHIQCPECGNNQNAVLFRTIWVEFPENMDLVLSNKINNFRCDRCDYSERLEFPFLCTNVKRGVAIWYEPYHDKQIDVDAELYRKHMGVNSFYAKAPRVADWKSFKTKLVELNAADPQPGQEAKQSAESKKFFRGFIDSLRRKQRD